MNVQNTDMNSLLPHLKYMAVCGCVDVYVDVYLDSYILLRTTCSVYLSEYK